MIVSPTGTRLQPTRPETPSADDCFRLPLFRFPFAFGANRPGGVAALSFVGVDFAVSVAVVQKFDQFHASGDVTPFLLDL